MSAVDLTNDQSVAQAVSQLTDLNTAVVAQGVELSPADRRQLLKMRQNGDLAVAAIIDLATRYNVTLPSYPLATLSADLALYKRVTPLTAAAEALAKSTDDELLAKGSKVWGGALTLYTALQSLAFRDPAIAHELALLKSFFAKKQVSSANAKAAQAGASPNPLGSGVTATPPSGATATPPAPPAPSPVTVINHPVTQGPVHASGNPGNGHMARRLGDRRKVVRPQSRERRLQRLA